MFDLFADLPATLPQERVDAILARSNVRIERIISHGQASPVGFWYDQAEHEFVVLLRGAARIRFDDETVELHAGSCLDIPAHRRHRVEWTTPDEPTIWLAVFYL
jgi:cupin 2 domain-containing protein